MNDVYAELVRLREAGERGVLVVVVDAAGSTPAKAGARLIVKSDGTLVGTVGGGALEHHAATVAPEVMAAGAPRLEPLQLGPDLGMSCGGRATLYYEPFGVASRLYLFGAGHIGVELCEMAGRCGFSVIVCDARDALRTEARFPRAARLVNSVHASEVGALGVADAAEHTYVVVVTHSHQLDFQLVEAIAPLAPAYLGMIGSAKKRRALEAHLQAAGVARQHAERVQCPAGLPLGGASPAEIALSITAQLVSARAQGADEPE